MIFKKLIDRLPNPIFKLVIIFDMLALLIVIGSLLRHNYTNTKGLIAFLCIMVSQVFYIIYQESQKKKK